MKATRNQIFLLFLNEGEPMARPLLKYRFEKKFGDRTDYKFLCPALTELINLGVIVEYDLEFSGVIEGASASHKEFGDIDLADVSSYIGLDELLVLSRSAASFAMENVGSLTREAADYGLDVALQTLTNMPIDSTAWTGLPKGFVFDEEARQQLIKLMREAEASLARSGVSNFDIGQGSGLLKAAIVLAESPEPPKSDIWSLLNKGGAIASIASLFLPLIAFLKGAS